INQYGIALAALVLIIVVGWGLRKLPMLERHADAISTIPLKLWWRIALGIITPILLGFMMWDSLRVELTKNYEGYSTGFLLLVGVIVSLLTWKKADQIAHTIDRDQEMKATGIDPDTTEDR